MLRALVVLLLWALPASAQSHDRIYGFFERHGCTLGPDSRAAALADGIAASDIDAAFADAASRGLVLDMGRGYLRLERSLCQIRLPQIDSPLSLETPVIARRLWGMATVDEALEEPCLIIGAAAALETEYTSRDYVAFLAAGFISGDLRFFSASPMTTPAAVQSVRGNCRDIPGIDDIDRAAAHVTDETFDTFIRKAGGLTECDGSGALHHTAPVISAALQGAHGLAEIEAGPRINAWLWFELQVIGWAAGWLEGGSWDAQGALRPPMCRYTG